MTPETRRRLEVQYLMLDWGYLPARRPRPPFFRPLLIDAANWLVWSAVAITALIAIGGSH